MRQLYESKEDRSNEREVASRLASIKACDFKKLPMAYYIDWVFLRNQKPVAIAEVKCRSNPSTQYPTLMLSLAKWMHGKQLAKELSVPFLVIIRWTDGIFWHEASDKSLISHGFGGRTDRNDDQDVEPVVYIPINHFRKIAS
jgi:hypothetical protein